MVGLADNIGLYPIKTNIAPTRAEPSGKKLSEPRHFLTRLVKLKFPFDIHFLSNKEFHAKFCTELEPRKLSRT